ncbi:FRG domain-containing protein [Cellulomonas edaphi]|uniref:FRG domain-containing protein n=1 Tax=Cellulomonas edaphi TaxID=3053468 RepID=A0ABT7S2P3_9CELL|nr:FRG domain-containing protein [Cellulomons edaphi]MDM7829877.1 FRG domain-containing protein [Cellulomons edaphi]
MSAGCRNGRERGDTVRDRRRATFDGVKDVGTGPRRVLHVQDPHALTQAAGWLKFTSTGGLVLFRGETRLHASTSSSALRAHSGRSLNGWAREFREFVDELLRSKCLCAQASPTAPRPPFSFSYGHLCTEKYDSRNGARSPIVSGTYRAAVEPLLQHYGLRTRWLDVVDNLWVALWFACHRQVTVGGQAHFLRRSVAQEGGDAMAYVVVMDTGPLRPAGIPGYQIGNDCRVIDLRYSVPSVYLRPHAQHGLLMAPRALHNPEMSNGPENSLNDRVAAHLRIRLGDALEWLGTGGMTSTYTLFPPATKDIGFKRLLESPIQPAPSLGAITFYGPGY